MMNNVDVIRQNINYAEFYAGYFPKYKKLNGNEWKVCCPFHDDKNPSMTVNVSSGMFNCFGCGAQGDFIKFHQKKHGLDFKATVDELMRLTNSRPVPEQKPEIVETYDYKDTNGNLVSQTVRYEPKKFLQRTKQNGKWVWSLKGVETVLYNLPDVVTADKVLVVEGEKDCETAKEFGFVATTCPMGAGKWRDRYTEALKGKEVVLIPDNDSVGAQHMLTVGNKLKDIATVKWFEFPGQKPKGYDFSDFARSYENEFEAMGQLDKFIRAARVFDPAKVIIPEPDSHESDAIKEWVQASPGEFSVRDLDYEMGFTSPEDKQKRTRILEKFVAESVLSREGKKRGVYRPYKAELETMDFINADDKFLDLWLPLGLHKMVGVMPGNVIIFAGEPNAGKALKNDTPILTTSGWVNISDITTSHKIFGVNGKVESVLGVFPQIGRRDCYRFSFNDGSWIDSDVEHIWTIQTDYQMRHKKTGNGFANKTYKQWINMTTGEIIKKYGLGKILKRRPKVPVNDSVDFPHQKVPVDPYILGALLGDGGIANGGVKVHTKDNEILERFRGEGYKLTHDNGVSYRIAVRPENVEYSGYTRKSGAVIPSFMRCIDTPEEKYRLKTHLKNMGLFGSNSHEKFVPKEYLVNSVHVRSEVLKGLMDTDGYIDKSGRTMEFCSTSQQLAEDVQFLARSIGARSNLKIEKSSYKKGEEKVECRPKYRVFIKTDKPVFYLDRKLSRQRKMGKTNEKKIVSIEHIGSHNTTCLKTSAKDGLFIAKDFIVTHNTALMLNIIKSNMRKFNVHYFNSEMGSGELRGRLSKFDDIPLSAWQFNAYSRDVDFADVVFTGENSLNIIDFLEIHDDFYLVGEKIKKIHAALNGGIAIICIQKNKGNEMALGGNRTMEKARLVVNVEPGKLKITKAKNFKKPDINPNGSICDFKLVNGCKFIMVGTKWYKET